MQDFTAFVSQHPMLFLAAVILIALLIIVEVMRNKRPAFNLAPQEAIQLINHKQAVVIDTRPKEAYKKGHIIHAHSMPGESIQSNLKKIEKFKSKPIIVVCPQGMGSQKIAQNLLQQGYQAYSLAGGLRSWSEAGLPLIKE